MPIRTLKIPATLYRSATIESKKGKLSMSISSDAPCLRDDWTGERYWEVLDHSPGGFADTRLRTGLPLLFNHNRDQHLGRAKGFQCDGHKITVTAHVWNRSAFAQGKKADMEAGSLVDTSIGYTILDEGKQIGRKDGHPIYRFKWEPHEHSLVTVPADSSVGVGRSHNPAEFIEISIQDNQNQNQIDTNYMPAPTTQTRERMSHEQLLEHQNKMRQTVAGISNPQWREQASGFIDEAILNQQTFGEFIVRCRDSFKTSSVAIDCDTYGSRDFFEARNGSRRSIGEQIARHPDMLQFSKGGKRAVAFDLKNVRAFNELRQRSTTTTTNAGVVTEQMPGIQGMAFETLTVADLLMPGVTSGGAVSFAREDSFTSEATTAGEASLATEQTFSISPDTAPVKKVSAWTKISDELLADSPACADQIGNRLGFAVNKASDLQLLSGDGMGTNIKGILTTAGIQTVHKGAESALDTIRLGIGAIDSNSDYRATGLVIHPTQWTTLSLIKDTTGRYIVGQVLMPNEFGIILRIPTLWGLPVSVSKSMATTSVLVVSRDAGSVFRRQGLSVEASNSNENDFLKGLITIRATERLALAIYNATGFCEVTGL